MKILHIIAGLNLGGSNMMLHKLLSAIDRTKFEPSVIVLMDRGALGSCVEDLDIQVHEVGMLRGRPTLGAARRIITLVNRLEPDLLQGWMYHANTAASLSDLFSRRKTPLLWNIRHTPYNLADENTLARLLIFLGARFSKRPQKIIYNSCTSARRHEELGYDPGRTIIIPNGFDTDKFKPDPVARNQLRASLELEEATPLIGMVARYHPMKDHNNFLQAAARLKQQHLDVHFMLVGDQIDKNNEVLTSKISALGLTERIHLLGERRDIASLLPGLDVATLSSAWGEGFPNVIGEAMACEIPCVVTNIGDSARIVAETGLVVQPHDPIALSKAWQEILALPHEEHKRLGTTARQRIHEHYALQRITTQYEELYQEILSEAVH